MAEVRAESLVKNFGAVQVLRDVSLEAKEGEFVALVGPSGCGKSTLLRCIAGLEEVQGGLIHIGGRVVNNLEPKERDAAMVFQNYALYPHMTVRQNMGYSLKLRGHKPAEIKPRVEEAAQILGLTDYLERHPRQLSGGQRQRVAMGRAIVRKPSVFLFDEPLSNLDAALRVQMRAEIRSLHKRLGVTSIYVTHDQIEAMTMADKIVVMRNGKVEQVGAPLELYERPANTFVATFIGSPAMNLLEGEWADDWFVAKTGETIALPGGSAGRKIHLGIRPEHLALAPSSENAMISGTVLQAECTGATSYAAVKALGTVLQLALPGTIPFTAGQPLHLTAAPHSLHVFDFDTGARLVR
ncbi:ABC transporter ATP-binding protein [Aestuariivirga litoralis]|uniref:ABC transporter ATP-binding protein n=1 Tax=Aestuariivirga litoralis TaxID=2650924 RepID=UPI0018C5BDBE|nr:sn-glycerol-3-phosphate ABC transporter ATP-binding protein UgpC [Aestuariivirga litoralis]MBG1232395.1 sn-glycerol-3-phosphate ABC transporter ATP-binding protein UgpC [Aestuariivirga litoralis]